MPACGNGCTACSMRCAMRPFGYQAWCSGVTRILGLAVTSWVRASGGLAVGRQGRCFCHQFPVTMRKGRKIRANGVGYACGTLVNAQLRVFQLRLAEGGR